jgi:hypothetical protein
MKRIGVMSNPILLVWVLHTFSFSLQLFPSWWLGFGVVGQIGTSEGVVGLLVGIVGTFVELDVPLNPKSKVPFLHLIIIIILIHYHKGLCTIGLSLPTGSLGLRFFRVFLFLRSVPGRLFNCAKLSRRIVNQEQEREGVGQV